MPNKLQEIGANTKSSAPLREPHVCAEETWVSANKLLKTYKKQRQMILTPRYNYIT